MHHRITTFAIIFIFSTLSCSKKITTYPLSEVQQVEEIATVRSDKREDCNCDDPNNYAPDPRFPQFEDIKYIRTNFHYPNDSSLERNYTGADALRYSEDLISNANRKLKKNQKMNLPAGNDTPVYDAGYRLKLMTDRKTSTGYAVYEDVDDEAWYYIKKGRGQNNYNKAIINRHAVHDDTILNIFAMVYPTDSLGSPTFKSGAAGIAMGTSLKIAGVKETKLNGAWKLAALLNHEVGHIFGLRHSWYKNDGCEDTPPHPNCWNSTDEGRCAGPTSNNMMDYNTQQMAITPCQIGMVRKNMHKDGNRVRELILKDWCTYNAEKSLIIEDDTQINRSVDMKGDIIIKDGASLRLSCRTHMATGAKIIIHPKATLILNGATIHNDCGEVWGGFEILEKGDKKGQIVYQGKVTIENLTENDNSSE